MTTDTETQAVTDHLPPVPEKGSNGRPSMRPLVEWAEWLAKQSADCKRIVAPLVERSGLSNNEGLYVVRDAARAALTHKSRLDQAGRERVLEFLARYPAQRARRVTAEEAKTEKAVTMLTPTDKQRLEIAWKAKDLKSEAEWLRGVILPQLDIEVPLAPEEREEG